MNIKNFNILVIGDFFLDEYIHGQIKRLSPEADVPIVNVQKKSVNLGGAGNVCNNLINIGCSVSIFGQIGNDENGKIILKEIKKNKKVKNFLTVNNKIKTIKKSRVLNNGKQVLRIDDEEIYKIKKLSQFFKIRLKKQITRSSLIIISDYGKGFCTKEICKFVINLAKSKNIKTIVDPRKNFNDYNKYINSNFITPNLNELKLLFPNIKNKDQDILKFSRKIIKRYKIDNIIATRSEKGLSFISKNLNINAKTVSKRVFDVSGAGDTVVAVFSILYLLKKNIEDCLKIANKCAGIVISKKGTKPITKNEFIKTLKNK